MRITIDYDPANNNFSVLFERNPASADAAWPPPPPDNDEFLQITDWLNNAYKASLDKFKDQKTTAIQYSYQPNAGKNQGFVSTFGSETPPPPPPFIRAK